MSISHHVKSFLHFGYLPSNSWDSVPKWLSEGKWSQSRHGYEKKVPDESKLVEAGIQSLKAAFHNIVKDDEGKVHIVGLSGGLDSRAILASLIGAGLKNRVITVTYGTPGTLDYELGCYVAQKMGVHSEKIDLTKVEVKEETLLETAQGSANWTFLIDAFFRSPIYKTFGKDVTYWLGHYGDPLAGSHLSTVESPTWVEAKKYFSNWNCFVRSCTLTPPDFHAENSLPPLPFLDRTCLSYDDQLDFAVRQECYIKRVTIPKGYDYRTPFLAPEWVNFILGVPHRYRLNCYIYKKILIKAYPAAFSLPTRRNSGLPLTASRWQLKLRGGQMRARSLLQSYWPSGPWAISPYTNYIDFDYAMREREDLKSVIYRNIQNLKKRNIVDWLDMDHIWQAHQKKKDNHGNALALLGALEINLKANGL